MSDILDYVADQLGIPRATTHHEVRIRQGLTLDGELRADGHRYLVQTTGGVARWDHISKLSLALQLLGTQENERDETLTALLVAAAIPPEIREAAKTANIQTIVAPAELLENVAREGTPILLTKPKSWAIIIGLLSRQVWPNIRALAEATKTANLGRKWSFPILRPAASSRSVEGSSH